MRFLRCGELAMDTLYGKWDIRFLKRARELSTWCKDPSTQVGAVILRPNLTAAREGFNGFARRMQDKPAWYADKEEKYRRIIHAEMNALLFAREVVEGYMMFTYPMAPCERCAVMLIQAG